MPLRCRSGRTAIGAKPIGNRSGGAVAMVTGLKKMCPTTASPASATKDTYGLPDVRRRSTSSASSERPKAARSTAATAATSCAVSTRIMRSTAVARRTAKRHGLCLRTPPWRHPIDHQMILLLHERHAAPPQGAADVLDDLALLGAAREPVHRRTQSGSSGAQATPLMCDPPSA